MGDTTGRGSYLWHLRKAARLDLLARSNHRRGFYKAAADATADAQKHRDAAALIDLEKRASDGDWEARFRGYIDHCDAA